MARRAAGGVGRLTRACPPPRTICERRARRSWLHRPRRGGATTAPPPSGHVDPPGAADVDARRRLGRLPDRAPGPDARMRSRARGTGRTSPSALPAASRRLRGRGGRHGLRDHDRCDGRARRAARGRPRDRRIRRRIRGPSPATRAVGGRRRGGGLRRLRRAGRRVGRGDVRRLREAGRHRHVARDARLRARARDARHGPGAVELRGDADVLAGRRLPARQLPAARRDAARGRRPGLDVAAVPRVPRGAFSRSCSTSSSEASSARHPSVRSSRRRRALRRSSTGTRSGAA